VSLPPFILSDWPHAYDTPPVRGVLRQEPADFFVEEQLGFEPDGVGEHCWLWVEKENLNTADAAQRLGRFSGLRERDISYSGLKDKRAITQQWFCLHLLNRDVDWAQWNDPALRILRAVRHSKKLRRGTHRSNRFEITLRDVQGDVGALQARAEMIRSHGVPNYFGEQRFGRDGRTLHLAMQAAQSGRRLTRQQTSLYFSAARSFMFNEVLAKRIKQSNWHTPLSGEVFMLRGSHSVFQQVMDAELQQRFERGDIQLTGPLAGRSNALSVSGAVQQIEADVLAQHDRLVGWLTAEKVDAARRSLQLTVPDLSVREIASGVWQFAFTLAKGCFATSLMRELADYSLPSSE
jgi:tRNA pseudouridine13 synthase